jgi:hypothetical protein
MTMTKISKIAILAALAGAIAAPAFAGDQDTATLLRDSGRYVPELNEPVQPHVAGAFAGAYASAVRGGHVRAFMSIPTPTNDFQLQGR